MIIDLRRIQDKTRTFHYRLEPDWWQDQVANDQILGLDGPLEVDGSIYRAGSKYVLEGRLAGTLMLRCDRCLETFRRPLDNGFRVFLEVPPPEPDQEEIELQEDDLMVDFIREEEVDVDDVVREEIFLSLPMKSLCREGCRGLCPRCGVNLNSETCGCSEKTGHPTFQKLKQLKTERK